MLFDPAWSSLRPASPDLDYLTLDAGSLHSSVRMRQQG